MISKSQKERAQKVIPGGTKKKGELLKDSKWPQKVKKKERKKNYPRRNDKKESSSKSLNDVNKSKRKTAKDYPRRNEKKGELLRPSGDLIRIGSKIAIQTINMFLSRTLSLLNYQHKLPQLLTSTIRKHTWTIRNTMECDATAWLVDFPNPYSHRHRGRNPFAQHLNYPKIDSSTNDYPKTTLTFFAFCRTVRKCVKALSENYPTKYGIFFWLSETRKKLSESCSVL